jgi:hypothetical protein
MTMKFLLAVLILAGLSQRSEAGPIATRSQLDSELGGGATEDTFADLPVVDGGQLRIFGPVDSTTVAPITCSQPNCSTASGTTVGPGLVTPGVTFERDSSLPYTYPIDLDGANYFGIPVKTIAGIYGPAVLDIVFTTSVTAVGFDLWSYKNFSAAGTVSVYDTSGNLLDTTSIADFSSPSAAESTFFGWESSGGIGEIVLSTPNHSNYWSIGTLEYGVAIPEPASVSLYGFVLLLGFGMLRTRNGATIERFPRRA